MPDGAAAEVFTAITLAASLNWVVIVYVDTVSHSDGAVFSESEGVSTIAGGQDTIEHIYASFDGGNNVSGGANTH